MESGAVITKPIFWEIRSGMDKTGSKSSVKLLQGMEVVYFDPPSSLDSLSKIPMGLTLPFHHEPRSPGALKHSRIQIPTFPGVPGGPAARNSCRAEA